MSLPRCEPDPPPPAAACAGRHRRCCRQACGVRRHHFHARAGKRSAGHEEAGVRVSHRNGTDDSVPFRALRRRAADPVRAGVAVARPGLALALDELERVAGGCPIVQRAVLEIQVERASVRLGRDAFRWARFVRHVEAAVHAGRPVTGHGAVIGVAFGRLERDAGGRPLVENLRALDPQLFQDDVVHHQLHR